VQAVHWTEADLVEQATRAEIVSQPGGGCCGVDAVRLGLGRADAAGRRFVGAAVLAGAVGLPSCSPVPQAPSDLVRSSEPIDHGICIAFDVDDPNQDADAPLWWWTTGGQRCASSNSSIVTSTGFINGVDGATTISFDIPLIPEGSDSYQLPIVQHAAGYALAVSGRLVPLEPIRELRLRSPGGIETPMP
jgi:hypothetical protein